MKIAIVSSVRLFREGLAASLGAMQPESELTTEAGLAALFDKAPGAQADVALIDVTQGIDLEEVGLLAARWPDLPLVALGLPERRDEIVRYGEAGFVSYVARDASMQDLQTALADAVAGRLQCPAEIAGGLMRALFGRHRATGAPAARPNLTGREGDVLRMIARGLSNKEIARDLHLSVATVKCHVHNVLAKLGVAQRSQAMRRVRAAPWLVAQP